jgi:3-hydroxyisobutyrate dehydrogenase-like beta-hydroxyacid dehydrogenase
VRAWAIMAGPGVKEDPRMTANLSSPNPPLTVGLLHPGQMGASIGAVLVSAGARVLWVSEGRSPASSRRAVAAGLVDAGDAATLLREASVVLVVCPPDAAVATAEAAAGARFRGIYADLNAVAPATASAIGATVAGGGARFVDGDLIGGPATGGHGPRLHLSGPDAATVAGLFAGTVIAAEVIGTEVEASSLKMCYAAWTKGTAALLLEIRALARASGVEAALLAEWSRSQPDLPRRSDGAAGVAGRGWRFAGEMEEIAATFAAAGLPGGHAQAAAEVYRRLAGFKDTDPPLDTVLAALLPD